MNTKESIFLTILLSIVVSYLTTYFREKAKNNAKKEDIGEITDIVEGIKGKISKEISVLTNLITVTSSSYQTAHKMRLDSIISSWDIILTIKERISDINVIYSILTEKEIENIYKIESKGNSNMRNILKNISHAELVKTLNQITVNFDKIRPFLGEELWKKIYIFRAFVLRVYHLTIEGIKNKKITNWIYDDNCMKLLLNILNIEETDYISTLTFDNLGTAIDLMEQKILNDIQKILSGENATTTSFNQFKIFQDIISKTKLDTRIDSDV